MFWNYLAVALRNIARHKLYSFINIAGLGVGLACATLIALFVRDELSYDKWIPNSENLYRVEATFRFPGRADIISTQTTMPLPLAMRDNLPEVKNATRLAMEQITMTVGDRQFSEPVALADPNFLEVIAFPLASGDPKTALAQPESIVISESNARKYFGDGDPIGKTILAEPPPCPPAAADCGATPVPLRVSGVMRDLPHNTQFDMGLLVPNNSVVDRISPEQKQEWLSTRSTYGYVTLTPGADAGRLLARLKPVLDRLVDLSSLTTAQVAGSAVLEPRLVPFRDVHLTTDGFGGMRPAGSWTTLYGLIVIGSLILLVACFNFMNLATARATLRAREISLRKCVGATRRQLIVQFLGEAVLMTFLSLLFALALVEVLLPAFSSFLQVPLSFHYLADWPLLLGIGAIAFLAALISGLYPALVLSGFRPANALRANSPGHPGSGRLRTALVVLQFAVSIGLGIAALVVYLQIDFARTMDLGFRRHNIVTINTGNRLAAAGMDSFTQALAKGPGITQVARSAFVPFGPGNINIPAQKPGDSQTIGTSLAPVTPDYFGLYGIRILAGRNFSADRGDDSYYRSDPDRPDFDPNEGHNMIINAAFARALGHTPASAVGQTVIMGKTHMKVAGVAADTLPGGLLSPVMPTAYVFPNPAPQRISILMEPGRSQEALAHITRVSHSFAPNAILARSFLDDSYERLYQSQQKQGQAFAAFVVIAIFIACLGLFGLAAFTAGRRTREIGIRKVFGARDRDVLILLLWQFSVPVVIANAIAWPLAWYYLHGWLQGFAYRITLSPLYFVAIGFAALVIAWATIFAHAWRVARANPVHALRYE